MTLRTFANGLAGAAAMAGALALVTGDVAGQSFCVSPTTKGMGPFVSSPVGQWQTAALTDSAPPLWDNLGSLHYPVTTTSPQAQGYFDQGLRLAYAFNHAEARRSFRQAQQLDPDCALCYWGEALVLGPNINAPMAPDALGPALVALGKAKGVQAVTEKERALIDALATRYSSDPQAARPELDAAYAEAMLALAGRFPDDTEIAVLAAEALMNTQPWDYWQVNDDGSTTAKGRTNEMIAMLEGVLDANPDHVGAIHYYIHMVEASDNPERAEPYADRLAAQMPGAGHIVHMPSHIYYRVGRYVDSMEINKDAVVADETFLAKADEAGFYQGTYYPHNVHFVLTSAQMAGDGTTAIEYAEKLAGVIDDEIASTVAWVQPIKAAPYFAHAQFSDPDIVLALPDPGDRFPYIKGVWHYARGVAYAAKGEAKLATDEANAVYEIATEADLSFLVDNYVPGDQLLEIAHYVVLGRIAQQQGDYEAAVERFKAAALIEDLMPYMEPPYWYYPVRQSLGAALLQAGRAEEAAEAFEASLKLAPNNGWAIYGLAEAQKAMGDAASAKASEAALAKAWAGPRELLEISKL